MSPREMVGRIGFYTLVALATAFFALPMLWLVSTPFDAQPGLALAIPDPTLGNFSELLDNRYALGSAQLDPVGGRDSASRRRIRGNGGVLPVAGPDPGP